MNVLVAKSVQDCEGWKGIAVVIDVLRTATTLCALLEKSNRPLILCGDEHVAVAIAQARPGLTLLSEQTLSLPYEDISPYLTRKISAHVPVLVMAPEVYRACRALQTSPAVVLGGFCNFYTLADMLAAQQSEVLLVPASLFAQSAAEEDMVCAAALRDCLHGTVAPERAVKELRGTMRVADFKNSGLKTAEKDLKCALKIDGFPVVPQITWAPSGAWAVCGLCGTPADPVWLSEEGMQIPQILPEKQQPAVEEQTPVVQPEDDQPGLESISLDTIPENSQTSDQSSDKQPEAIMPSMEQAPEEKVCEAAASEAIPAQEFALPEPTVPTDCKEKETKGKKSSLKGFFSQLARSVKEEKEELEQTLREAVGGEKPTSASRLLDPMDKMLQQADKRASDGLSDVKPIEMEPAAVAEAVAKPGSKKAIVLFSGGLDSTTCLYWAISEGYTCEALTVSYGQRHLKEITAAQTICHRLGVKHHVVELNLPWLAISSLVDARKPLPDVAVEKIPHSGIPSTYVPGRNLMFLSIAGSLLDTVEANAIVAGPNAVDFSGYPDCTPAFLKAVGEALNRGTSRGVSEGIEVLAPLMRLTKAEIVKLAVSLKVPFELTWSCYAGGKKPCGKCDSCKLRAKGFEEAGVHDTALD